MWNCILQQNCQRSKLILMGRPWEENFHQHTITSLVKELRDTGSVINNDKNYSGPNLEWKLFTYFPGDRLISDRTENPSSLYLISLIWVPWTTFFGATSRRKGIKTHTIERLKENIKVEIRHEERGWHDLLERFIKNFKVCMGHVIN